MLLIKFSKLSFKVSLSLVSHRCLVFLTGCRGLVNFLFCVGATFVLIFRIRIEESLKL